MISCDILANARFRLKDRARQIFYRILSEIEPQTKIDLVNGMHFEN